MIFVLTYDAPHRKTQDLLLKLKVRGYNDVQVLATPWESRENFKSLIPHRQFTPDPISLKDLALSKKIINSHPAYLPYTRGLDSLKWAIFNGNPIGVTTHIISDEADTGWLISKRMLPLYSWDTFHSVA